MAERLSHLALPQQEELKQAVKPFKKTRILASVLQSPTGTSEMEIILLTSMSLFTPADRPGLYLQSGEGSSKEAQKLLDPLERWKLLLVSLRHKRDLEVVCQPVFTETGGIEGETLYHPLLSNPIANDVHFQKIWSSVGDNASGKSTYLKTVAINAILAQGLGFAYGEKISPSLWSCANGYGCER